MVSSNSNQKPELDDKTQHITDILTIRYTILSLIDVLFCVVFKLIVVAAS